MKIGITERGDAGINSAWTEKMDTVDGAILITKNITETFKTAVLSCEKPVIVHCTCTGHGGTVLEPNVPDYMTQLNNLKDLIDRGFPANKCVLRIDPIFPSEEGIEKVHNVLSYFESLNTGVKRIRVSVVDEYRHVKERYRAKGISPLYGEGFQANENQLSLVTENLAMYPRVYELCAENKLWQQSLTRYPNLFKVTGCISQKDLELMGIPYVEMDINPQKRNGCHCLSCKTELLTERKPCPNKCLYCFWRG